MRTAFFKGVKGKEAEFYMPLAGGGLMKLNMPDNKWRIVLFKKWRIALTGLLLSAFLLTAGCASGNNASQAPEATTQTDYSDLVAGEDDMIAIDEVVKEGMEPVEGKDIRDGVYQIEVASSSAMFNIEKCELTVQKGEMTAVMTMGGTGYEYLFMGTGIDAVKAGDGYIPYEETSDGKNTFTVPVESLNSAVKCSAFSKRKQKWYDRTLCFKADNIPLDAFAQGAVNTVESLGLSDGSYIVEVTLGGGSGRSELESPTSFTVQDGKCMAVITWSSPYYDYMIVEGERYEPVSAEGNSVFEIPVKAFDYALSVIADTTRMSKPYEIEYVLNFDSSSIRKQ